MVTAPEVLRLRGRVVTATTVIPDGIVEVRGRVVGSVRPAGSDDPQPPTSHTILPGLVDLHCHGGGGASFTVGDSAEVDAAAAHHLGVGTTSLVASAVTDSPERMLAVVASLADGVERGVIEAVHSEGPFLSLRRCGAQDPTWLTAPDVGLAREIVEAARGHLRVMTLAPELPGAAAVAEMLRENGVVVAAGHTDADARTTSDFLKSFSPSLVTHLFNGMPAFHHRAPGPTGGALSAAAAGSSCLELIADGVHVADEAASTMLALLPGRVSLVSDAMSAAGMPDGIYQLGPQRVHVQASVARLADGESIAGGTLRLLDIVRRMVHAGCDLVTAVAAASAVPAAVIGRAEQIGQLRPGARADLLVVDDGLRPVDVMRAGTWIR